MIFDAATLARAWLAVSVATGQDDSLPQLHRTVCVEEHTRGIMLIATDGHLLLRSWVPLNEFGDDPDTEPGLDEAPVNVTVAVDADNRVRALMAYARALTKSDSAEPFDITVLERADEDDQPSLGGMGCRTLLVEIPGTERVLLPVYDGAWVDWRSIVARHTETATDRVAFGPAVLPALAKLRSLYPAAVQFSFGGSGGAALLRIAGWPPLCGLVMPMRGLVMPMRILDEASP